MAYIRQSKKRKTPLKAAYGEAQLREPKFKDLKESKGNPNLVGQAVGAIGTEIGDAYDAYKEGKDDGGFKDFNEKQNTKGTIETVGAQGAQGISGTGITTSGLTPPIPASVNATGPEGDKTEPPKKIEAAGRTKTYADVEADAYSQYLEANPGDESGAKDAQTKAGASARSYNQKKYQTHNPTEEKAEVNNIIKDSGNPYIAGTAERFGTDSTATESKDSVFNREASPLRRLAPLYRSPLFQTKGRTMGDLAQSSLTNISYLGDVGRAGAEGYNSEIDRQNYKQLVAEEQAAELDEQFGELEVEPSGYNSYDASVEKLSRGWKEGFVADKKAWKSGKMSNEDWINSKHKYQNFAKQYALGAKNLKSSIASWEENKGKISNSTKPEVIDFYNTMSKYPDRLTVQTGEDGNPYFVGETIGGKPINWPLSKLASGEAQMRFNTKVDVDELIQPTVKAIEKLKTEIPGGFGNVQWDNPAIQSKVNQSLDAILENDSELRSIAAEKLGYDYDEFQEFLESNGGDLEGMKLMRNQIKATLKDEMRQSYFPVRKDDPTPRNAQGGVAGLTGNQQLKYAQDQQAQQQLQIDLDQGFKDDFKTYYNPNVQEVAVDDGKGWFSDSPKTYTVTLKNGVVKEDLTEEEARRFLNRASGGKGDANAGPGNLSAADRVAQARNKGKTPTKRLKSPFRRAYDWMSGK